MRRGVGILVALALATGAARAAPSTIPPSDFATFAFEQHLGAALPLDLILYEADGKPVRFGALFDGRPVLLDFEYDRCTTLCGVMLDQLKSALQALPIAADRDYRLVAIDIDPEATPQQAADFAKAHGIDGDGTTVLTGDAAAIRRLAGTAGFPYRRDDVTGQYAHPAGFVVATPHGTISRYLLGLDWRPLDLRLALAEAAGGGVAAPARALLLFCYCYDPQTGRYDLAVGRLLQIVGAATLLVVGGIVVTARRVL
jgi:protein SCO1/2